MRLPKFVHTFLDKWDPRRLQDVIHGQKYHLSLCVDALTRIYQEKHYIGTEPTTMDMLCKALTIADPKGDLAMIHLQMEDGFVGVQHPSFHLYAKGFIEDFERTGAENYLAVTFDSQKFGTIEVTAQRVSGLTPATKNMQLSATIKELEMEVEKQKTHFKFLWQAQQEVTREAEEISTALETLGMGGYSPSNPEDPGPDPHDFDLWTIEEFKRQANLTLGFVKRFHHDFETDFVLDGEVVDAPEQRW